MKPIQEIVPLLQEPRKVVITMHQKPDPDAMGSALGLYHFLKQFGHSVTVISPTNWAKFLDWMDGCDTVLDYELYRDKCDNILNEAQWLFCLDFNSFPRAKHMAGKMKELTCTKILIDHHQHPDVASFDYGISDTGKSSTCEMVYDFILSAGDEGMINNSIAECLYSGVMADTGSFRFPTATAEVHKMISALKEKGLQHTKVHENIYDNFHENRLRFIGHVLLHRMEVYYEYNTALIAISKKDLLKYQVKTGDSEGFVNYPLSIQGIKLAALVIDRDEERKWSFRSKGDFNVNAFARQYFEGGGHFNASGGRSSDPLEKTVQHFLQAMKENALQLQ